MRWKSLKTLIRTKQQGTYTVSVLSDFCLVLPHNLMTDVGKEPTGATATRQPLGNQAESQRQRTSTAAAAAAG